MKLIYHKLDAIFWWLIWLLPLLGALICLAFGGDNTFLEFAGYIDGFSFGFIKDIVADLQSVLTFSLPSVLVSYASYIVSVEIVHVFVDVMIFIPRFAHKLFDPDTYSWRIKK